MLYTLLLSWLSFDGGLAVILYDVDAVELFVHFFFFFQAEDGIRDLVRSRGLGDVYKRQVRVDASPGGDPGVDLGVHGVEGGRGGAGVLRGVPVSYTHLTLPTSDLV